MQKPLHFLLVPQIPVVPTPPYRGFRLVLACRRHVATTRSYGFELFLPQNQARKKGINIHFWVRLPLRRPRVSQGQTRLVHETNPVCAGDEPRSSPFFLQSKGSFLRNNCVWSRDKLQRLKVACRSILGLSGLSLDFLVLLGLPGKLRHIMWAFKISGPQGTTTLV